MAFIECTVVDKDGGGSAGVASVRASRILMVTDVPDDMPAAGANALIHLNTIGVALYVVETRAEILRRIEEAEGG